MDFWLLILFTVAETKMICEKTKAPLELGEWKYNLKHMDSAVVENRPVSINEGQMYVYENYFPDYTIKYIHVDNLAIRSCGATATIKSGGLGTSSILVVLHADMNQEIRSVVDIWGEKTPQKTTRVPYTKIEAKTAKSLDLFKKVRAVSHNKAY